MNIEKIKAYLNQFNFDLRKTGNARWIDQKCTPDVICIIADCILNFVENSDEVLFTVNDIWDSPYFTQNVVEIFNKPHPRTPSAGSEYDKVIGQPLKMFAYANILTCEKIGTTNYYSLKEFKVLEFIASKEFNAYKFLNEYIQKVLEDSGLMDRFNKFRDSYKSNQAPKQALIDLKTHYKNFIHKYTPIKGDLEISRIFSKVLNPYSAVNGIAGIRKGYLSKNIIAYSDLLYNQTNWRDIGKEKYLTRQEFEDKTTTAPNVVAMSKYYIQKAKKQIARKYEFSEVNDEFAKGDATQVHHIFPESDYPHLAAFLENLIKLTPQQHYTRAHPKNNTHIIDSDYQLVCLLSKLISIRTSLDKNEEFYDKGNFVFVVNEGVHEEIVRNDLDFDLIEQKLSFYYNQRNVQ